MKDCLVQDKGAAIDPDEAQRRLGQVYVLLIDLARQKRTAIQPGPANMAPASG